MPTCNFSIPADQCTLSTCCLSQATLHYLPNFGANVAYLVIFSVLLGLQFIMCIRYRTWKFSLPLMCGILLEIIGYAARLWMRSEIFLLNPFVLYLIALTIAPAFMSASIYQSLGQVIMRKDPSLSRLKPRSYTLIFVSSDILCLILQAVGGALAAEGVRKDKHKLHTGTDIMVSGLALQVFSLLVFIVVSFDYALRYWKKYYAGTRATRHLDDDYNEEDRRATPMQNFVFGLGLATLTIFVRCVFRVAELQAGFGGQLANDQTLFMIFEGPMIIIAVGALTLYHPGRCLRTQAESGATPPLNEKPTEGVSVKTTENNKTSRA